MAPTNSNFTSLQTMSEPINANPTVLDVSQLPKRQIASNNKPKVRGYEDRTLKLVLEDPLYLYSADQYNKTILDYSEEDSESESGEEFEEPIDAQEIYDLIATISDPEHPLTLGQLAVVNLDDIQVNDSRDPNELSYINIDITPTITHCSLATLIGLGIRVRLDRCLPARFRVSINVKKGTHQSELQVNKQLNDKERIAAACENEQLLGVLSNMLATCA